MKTIIKSTLILSFLVFGLTMSANAQILDFLNKAVETVGRATETYNNARDTYNDVRETFSNSSSQNNTPSYSRVGSVSMVFWHAYGKGSASADIVVDGSGEKYIRSNGSNYTIYENYSYDPYDRDSNSPSHYKYYINKSNKEYYFNM